jgi:hypothetical protein
VLPDDAADPTVFTREKERLMSAISETQLEAATRMPDVYARLAYNDEVPRATTSCACSSSRRSAKRA